jgi:hypothetical protein
MLQSSHIMILNSIKFGGNRTKDLEVCPDKQTYGQTDRPFPIYTIPDIEKFLPVAIFKWPSQYRKNSTFSDIIKI